MSLKSLFVIFLSTTCMTNQPFTIMLDPTGDGQYAGREIQDTFERGITLQCAQELKKQLTDHFPNIRVVLTRAAGETIQPMHNALFSNRLQAELYLRIGFYHEPDMPSHIALFYYCQNPTDFWQKINPLQFYQIDQAHLLNLTLTKQLTTNFFQILQNNHFNSVFVPYGIFAIPCKPLIGIQAPAIYLEAGLHNSGDWKYIIKPIIAFVESIINTSVHA